MKFRRGIIKKKRKGPFDENIECLDLKEDGRKLRFLGIGGTFSRPIRGHRAKQPIHFISPAVLLSANGVLTPCFPPRNPRFRATSTVYAIHPRKKVCKTKPWRVVPAGNIGRSIGNGLTTANSAADWIVFRRNNFVIRAATNFFEIKFGETNDSMTNTIVIGQNDNAFNFSRVEKFGNENERKLK